MNVLFRFYLFLSSDVCSVVVFWQGCEGESGRFLIGR